MKDEASLLAQLPAPAQEAIRRAITAEPQQSYEHVQRAFAEVSFPKPPKPHTPVYPLASTLDDAQRALAELTCLYPFNVFPFALPGPIATRRRWLGLDPPSVLESQRVGEEPLWRALQLAGGVKEQGAILDELPTVVALEALAEMMLNNNMDYRVEATEIVSYGNVRLVREMKDEARAWAVAMANRLAANERGVQWTLSMLVFLALVRAGVPIDPRWERFFPCRYEVPDSIILECARALPPDRRDAVLSSRVPGTLSGRALSRILDEFASADLVRALLAAYEVNSPGWNSMVSELRGRQKRQPVIAPVLDAALASAPKPLGLVVASSHKAETIADLDEIERKQLRAAGKRVDGRDLSAVKRMTPPSDPNDEESPDLGFLDIAHIADESGTVVYDVLQYMADRGTIFHAGTTKVVADIVQGGVELLEKRPELRNALNVAFATPTRSNPKAPAKKKKKARKKTAPAKNRGAKRKKVRER